MEAAGWQVAIRTRRTLKSPSDEMIMRGEWRIGARLLHESDELLQSSSITRGPDRADQKRQPFIGFFLRADDGVAATTTKSLTSHVNGGF